jgi:outer membrane protein TolC
VNCKNHIRLLNTLARLACGLLLCGAFSLYCSCQAADSTPKLSLAEAVARALEDNAGLVRAEENRLSALSRMRIAGFAFNYGLGARTEMDRTSSASELSSRAFGNVTYKGLLGTELTLDLSPFGTGNERSSIDLRLRHPLISGKGALSQKANLLAGARADATIQDKEYYLTRQATVQHVVEAYYRAVLAREQVKVQERAVSIAEEVADGARKRAAEGLVPEIDVSRADIRVARTRDQLNLQRQTARAASDRLMVAIGSGVGEDAELVDAVPDAPADIPGLADAVKTALENRGELAVYDQQLSEQKRKLSIATDQLRPRLDVFAGLNSSSDEAGVISKSFIDAGSFQAGLEYRFPLDKRIDTENKDTAARSLEVSQRLRTFQMEEIVEQVRSAYRRVDTSRISLQILGQNVKVAEENLRLAQRMVEEGLDDNRNVLEAQESLTQVENGLLSAKIDLYLASINLKYAMGEDLAAMETK